MTPPVVVFDSAIFVYVLGTDHELRGPCVETLKAVTKKRLRAHASVESVQEILFHRLRRTDRTTALAQARDVARSCVLHPFDEAVMRRMFDLIASHARIRGRDAVHAATALLHRIPTIISPDAAFDGIDGLERVDPRDIEEFLAGAT